MEKLPIELVPHIFAALEEHKTEDPFDKLDNLNISLSKESAKDICNLRLVCRNFHAGSDKSFAKAISRHDFNLTKKSIDALDKMVDNKKLAYYIDTLTFNDDVPYIVGLLQRPTAFAYLTKLASVEQLLELGKLASLREIESHNGKMWWSNNMYHMSDEPVNKLREIFKKCPKLKGIRYVPAETKCWMNEWPDQEVAAILADIVKNDNPIRHIDNCLNYYGLVNLETLDKAMKGSEIAFTSLTVHGQRVSPNITNPTGMLPITQKGWCQLAQHTFSTIKVLDLEFQSDMPDTHSWAAMNAGGYLDAMPGITTLRLEFSQHHAGTYGGGDAMANGFLDRFNASTTILPNLVDFCLIANVQSTPLIIFLANHASSLRSFRLQPEYDHRNHGKLSQRLHNREEHLDHLLENLVGVLDLDYLAIREPLIARKTAKPTGPECGSYNRREKWEPMLAQIAKHYRIAGSRLTVYKAEQTTCEWGFSERIEGIAQGMDKSKKTTMDNVQMGATAVKNYDDGLLGLNFEWNSSWRCLCHRNRGRMLPKMIEPWGDLNEMIELDD